MEQLILTTLLKYNDIFDAFQKLFELHNYNCADQRVKISQYLKQPQSECIYITLNKSSDIIPFQEEFEKQEKKIKSLLLDDRVVLERYFQTNIESQMIQLKSELSEEQEKYQCEIVDLKNFIHEMYQTKTDSRQQRSNFEERLLKMNEQMEYFQSKYALKTYTEQNVGEIKNSISNISQSINFLRQDAQTLHKQTKENKLIQQNHNDQFTQSIQTIQSDLEVLDKYQMEIETMRTDLNSMQEENEKMYVKFKSIAQLFQELDANNSNTVKFQIHAAIKVVNDEIMALKYKQQSFQDQIVVYKENMDQHLQSSFIFSNNCQQQFDRFENEQEYNAKQFKIISKMLEQYKQLQQSAQQNDVLPRMLQLQTNQAKFQSYCNSLFHQIKKTIDVIQDFCETSQLTTPTSEQDVTNLILLMDRRIMEFSKCFHEPTKSKMPSVKLQTPRLSTSIDSPFRIHSKQKQSSQKPINQTISFDQRRDSIL